LFSLFAAKFPGGVTQFQLYILGPSPSQVGLRTGAVHKNTLCIAKPSNAGRQATLRHESKSLQKGITTLLEASHDHLLITPPSHVTPQKVEGLVVEFTRGNEDKKNILLC
jgi:hypothetical protein